MQAIFLDRATIDPSIDFSKLEESVDELVSYPTTRPEQTLQRSQGFEIVITNKVVFDAELLDELPDLKLICVTATGTNNIDIPAAEARGISVTNVSGYSTGSVVQHLFAFLLNHLNRVNEYLQNNQQKPWAKSETFCQIDFPIRELNGLTLGILGYGTIGKAVARVAESFGMKVLVAERAGAETIRSSRVTFEEMIVASDIVSVHCPLTEQTQGLFKATVFNAMKPGSIFINTGRGPIMNSADLAQALTSGQLSHAIVDVLEQEPPPADHPLLSLSSDQISLTPHIAWGSLKAQQVLMDGVARNIEDFS